MSAEVNLEKDLQDIIDNKGRAHQSKALTFGSIIYLSESEEPTNYIYSDGIIDRNISIKDFKNKNKKYFQKCLFQIYPPFVNTYKKDAVKENDKQKKIARG